MFKPTHVYFEKSALSYKQAKELKKKLENSHLPVDRIEDNQINVMKGTEGEKTDASLMPVLVVSVYKNQEFKRAYPLADYALPLVSGCVGRCEYCQLNQFNRAPSLIKVFVNMDEILKKVKRYAQKKELVTFEGSLEADPIPTERYTHALAQMIGFTAKHSHIRFSFTTKYTEIDSLLCLRHNGQTTVRFSLNTDTVIESFEEGTPPMKERIEAAFKVMKAGYPVGFVIAPVFIYPNWREDYLMLIKRLKEYLANAHPTQPVTFEIIAHRFMKVAKNHLFQVVEDTYLLPDPKEMTQKYGPYAYGKNSYDPQTMAQIKELFEFGLAHLPFKYEIKYIV